MKMFCLRGENIKRKAEINKIFRNISNEYYVTDEVESKKYIRATRKKQMKAPIYSYWFPRS